MAGASTVTGEPAWLVAYRRGETAPPAPAQPPLQPQAAPAQGLGGGEGRSPAVAPAQPRPNEFGFSEPRLEAWPFDGGKRREPVLDHDQSPPRVVRRVGWRVCLRCGSPFWSTDVTAIRLCHGCKQPSDRRAGVARGGAG